MKLNTKGRSLSFPSLWHLRAFTNVSGCHLDKTKSCTLPFIWLHVWKDRSGEDVIVVAIRSPTAPQQVCRLSPADSNPMWNSSSVSAFCSVELNGSLPPFHLVSFAGFPLFHPVLHSISPRSISPVIRVIFYTWLSPLSSRSPACGVGVSEKAGAGSGREAEDNGCTLSFFCFASQRPARRLDYHVCFVRERGIALRGLLNTVPFFSAVAGHEERYSREEERFQFTLALCLCLYNCAYLFWEDPR